MHIWSKICVVDVYKHVVCIAEVLYSSHTIAGHKVSFPKV